MKIQGPKTALKKLHCLASGQIGIFFLKNKYHELARDSIESRNNGRLPKSSNLNKYNLVVQPSEPTYYYFLFLEPWA